MRGTALGACAGWNKMLVLAALTVSLLMAPPLADADIFGPISLVSEGTFAGMAPEQAEYTHDPAISGNGQYVAFDGSVGGVTGVWRRDLATGAIEQVAGGDAELPSISEDGRYLSFTTNEGASLPEITDGRPEAAPKPEAVNVYVRDMDVPVPASGRCEPSQACPFLVVSAPSGSVQPLTYASTPTTTTTATTTGSAAIGRSAISADGQEVAFVTTAVSDLVKTEKDRAAEAKGEPPPPETPALQVAVRYLGSATTKLVSGRYDPASGQTTEEPVATEQDGAVYPGEGVQFTSPPAYGKYGSDPPPGASLSADGSTVAWMGQDIGEQAPLLVGETRVPSYTEPLWRRIAPGSQTPTERVTGGSDPENPGCVASGETVLAQEPSPSDPCQGPFATPEGAGNPPGILAGGEGYNFVPRLSADGYTVAFVSRAPLVSLGENFGRGSSGQPSDLYVANMDSNPTRPTRDQALTQLTELAGGESAGIADTGSIVDFDISPNGDQVAFTTRRTQFPLGSPALVTAPAAEPGMSELFDADLVNHTLTRVTQGYDGGPSEHPHIPRRPGEEPYEYETDGALSPSFSTDGDVLAFSSTASNLVWGDGNTPPAEEGGEVGVADGSDAFLVERVGFSSTPTPQLISPPPAGPPLTPAWNLGVSALSRPNGTVVLYVEVPARGALRATAQSAVPLQSTAPSRAARRGRRAAKSHGHTSRVHRAGAEHARSRALVASRTVAVAPTAPTHAVELVTLTLRLAKPYTALASKPGGLSATVRVLFAASSGGPVLRQSIPVSFLLTAHASRGASKSARRGRRRR